MEIEKTREEKSLTILQDAKGNKLLKNIDKKEKNTLILNSIILGILLIAVVVYFIVAGVSNLSTTILVIIGAVVFAFIISFSIVKSFLKLKKTEVDILPIGNIIGSFVSYVDNLESSNFSLVDIEKVAITPDEKGAMAQMIFRAKNSNIYTFEAVKNFEEIKQYILSLNLNIEFI